MFKMNEIKVKNILDDVKINRSRIGYYYWIDLCSLALNSKKIKITNLYNQIAKKYKVSSSSVEAAIRSSIINNTNEIKEYFNINTKINSKTFLMLLLDRIG